jgi:hypothetical protein
MAIMTENVQDASARRRPPAERKTVSAAARVRKARAQFQALTGLGPESISGLVRVDGGWEIHIDVVELRRIPDSASLLATYRVTTDDAGDVTGYERVRRFNRGKAD